jgi:type IV pilus assembly protein PilA
MFRRRQERSKSSDDGFTLIELLVVVVIIGVLIAIAIPLYLNYRKGAENKSAAADLRGGIATLEQCYTDSNNVYPKTVSAAGVPSAECLTANAAIKLSAGTALTYVPNATWTQYILASAHTSNGTWYCYSSTVGGSVKTEPAATAVTSTYPTTAPFACP